MRYFSLIFQYFCLGYALYLSYQIGLSLYHQDYDLMDVVGDIGTVLICIDLGIFLYTSKAAQGISLQEYAHQLEQPPSKLVYITRKLGHLGIMLIICSWLVPLTA